MGKIASWVEQRVPIKAFFKHHLVEYKAPKNLNFWYFFGVFSIVVLINQLLTGIWLTMVYTPTAEQAFVSIEYLMRHVPFGWLLRYLHSTGASAFFIVIYLHIYRAVMYGSYKAPRELLWLTGVFLFLLLMAEAFTGYVLPWGQMSYWGAKFILLDEPFAGIDPITIKNTKEILKSIAKKGTGIFISDHNAPDTLDLCDWIYVLYNGSVLTQGTAQTIQNDQSVKTLYLGH